jgi:hypothetical protein
MATVGVEQETVVISAKEQAGIGVLGGVLIKHVIDRL